MHNLNYLIADYYEKSYAQIHYQGSLGKFTSAYHRALENKLEELHFQVTLEIGSGTGEHLQFVKHTYEKYLLLDPEVSEPIKKLAATSKKFEILQAKAEKIPLPNDSVDRIVCTCVLLHLDNVYEALSEIRRVARNGSLVSLYLPMDPGMLYRYIRHLGSHLKMKKNMNTTMKTVKFVWANEHKNHYLAVKKNIEFVFQDDVITFHNEPFAGLSWNFNLYSIIRIEIRK